MQEISIEINNKSIGIPLVSTSYIQLLILFITQLKVLYLKPTIGRYSILLILNSRVLLILNSRVINDYFLYANSTQKLSLRAI